MSWGALIGSVGSLLGSGEQADAAAKSAETTAWAQQAATASKEKMFQEGEEFLDPYRQAGEMGLQAYDAAPMYGFSPEDLYRLQENQEGLRRVYAAQGKRQSGEAARGAANLFEKATADAYNRAYGRLYGAAGIGAQAAGMGAGQAMQTGQGIASAYMQGAQNQIPYIQAQGQLSAANIAALSNLGGSLANYYQANQPAVPDYSKAGWYGEAEGYR